ncbi:hypothetical protein [Flammeovirga pacifica]|uniref:STAS/SEC14 domain-containing protein n=1 Tax=Flammeovirga pacifica TaxID=915059 RepID=A0A1S1YTU5_FLAPC|nr:hypothetical protein [Flammeovirga pacifica]OHX64225.1 hypothetical protein NH26_21720 [Flammeovirga pacifica]
MKKIYTNNIAVIDTGEFPIVKMTCIKASLTSIDVLEFKKFKEQIFDMFTEPFILIDDGTQIEWLSNDAKLEYGRLICEHDRRYKDLMISYYLVIPNTYLKLIIRAINKVFKPKIKQLAYNSFKTAHRFALIEKEVMLNLPQVS